jgi:hypothetical protein
MEGMNAFLVVLRFVWRMLARLARLPGERLRRILGWLLPCWIFKG